MRAIFMLSRAIVDFGHRRATIIDHRRSPWPQRGEQLMEPVRDNYLAAMRKEICRVKTRFRKRDGSAFFPVIAK